MHTRFASFVSALTLSTLFVSPVSALSTPYAETMAAVPIPTIASCQETVLPVYRLSLEAALGDMRGSVVDEWKDQVTFRVNAATRTRRAAAQRALQQAGTQLDGSLNTFYKTQTNGVDADVRVAVRALEMEDMEASELALERWSKQTVSFRALDTVLARMERTLRQYATAREATTISRVWNETRKQAQSEFNQARLNAREVFIQEMNDCLAGIVNEEATEELAPTEEQKPAEPINKPVDSLLVPQDMNGGTAKTGTRIVEVQFARSGLEPIYVCGDYTVEYIGFVRLSQPGASFTYRIERSDGARTPEAVATTNAYGVANVFYNWNLGRPMYGWARLIVTLPSDPTQSMDSSTSFTAVEKTYCPTPGAVNNPFTPAKPAINTPTPDQENAPSNNDLRAEALVSSRAEAAVCGNYLFQFKGRVSTTSPTTITYRWERSDGVVSPERKMSFDAAGDHVVTPESWDLGGTYSGSVKLHILSPVDLLSNPAPIRITQMCR
ncbi:hypothetical protein KBD61_05580 [Patescibacteria group bacterium]|nr:hypothetical protein [Patescibacteria group bacterium]MBP9710462.1 hypothetical protein [Patescibacteria group bacterium]